jgi:hypothetical protein
LAGHLQVHEDWLRGYVYSECREAVAAKAQKEVENQLRTQLEKYREEMIRQARLAYQHDEVRIDDKAPLSQAKAGCWVGAWVWIAQEPEEVRC